MFEQSVSWNIYPNLLFKVTFTSLEGETPAPTSMHFYGVGRQQKNFKIAAMLNEHYQVKDFWSTPEEILTDLGMKSDYKTTEQYVFDKFKLESEK